jgi:hypothetical protein
MLYGMGNFSLGSAQEEGEKCKSTEALYLHDELK